MQKRLDIVKLPHNSHSISHSCPVTSHHLKSFSNGVSQTQPFHNRGHHLVTTLKLDLSLSEKIRCLSLTLYQLWGFPLPRFYRIVASISSHTIAARRLFRNRRAATTPFYTCATALSRRFFSLSPSAFQFLSTYARKRSGKIGKEGERDGRTSG